ncbi:unnamed protein product [Owenia fusiformis]|uniref:Uncharacterized protein n=1 Tax=Owenia fusiformis TaxID=6347 RepID=A0A8J1YAV1_OWEFU|nr:unnamed protein product [Owenia fusiformis]
MLGYGTMNKTSSISESSPRYLIVQERFGNMSDLKFARTCRGKYVVHLSCNLAECGTKSKNNPLVPLIVGGNQAQSGDWPWQVGLAYLGFAHFCGGVLVAEEWVLTAGHCIDVLRSLGRLSRTYILAGAHVRGAKRQWSPVSASFMHPVYVPRTGIAQTMDIGLIRLARKFRITDYVRPVCLPSKDHDFRDDDSLECYMSGFGYTKPHGPGAQILGYAKMVIQPNCSWAYEGWLDTRNLLCAGYDTGHISTCRGDSGGPLMCRSHDNKWTVAGISSFSLTTCISQYGYPSAFTEVAKAVQWIEKTIQENR